jgi:predicted Zn-ribbon and HTH transcriptional regulator
MQFTAINFTCPSCGAPQKFSPATGTLICEFCGKETPIEKADTPIREHSLNHALQTLDQTPNQLIEKQVHCKKCGSEFTLTPYAFSTNCPYCGTPAITDFVKEITPQSLIPFKLTHKEAQARFKAWVGSLWFAPSAFTKYLDGDNKLSGYYLPYWTYDSDTITHYQGERGDIYYVTVTKTVIDEQGRRRQMQVQEPRIRWTPVSGSVTLSFDDITIGASQTVTRTILRALEPWDTSALQPFDEKYLSGFEAEEYTVGLDNGFEYAKIRMQRHIEAAIRRDIGGDQQQITSVQTQYLHTTYKNILLPIWLATFEWDGKTYRYAVNAQTGKVSGERPYSWLKIFFAVLSAAAVAGGALYLNAHPEIITQIRTFLGQ